MGTRIPTLRQHQSGHWISSWGGHTHYFGRDKAKAYADFVDPASENPGSLRAWQLHRAAKLRLKPARPSAVITIGELAIRYIDSAKPGTRQAAYRRGHLRRFVLTFGTIPTYRLDEEAIAAFARSVADLKFDGRRLAPKTVAHEVNAIKSLLRWGMNPANGRLVPALDLSSVRPPRVRRGEPEDIPLATIRDTLDRIQRTHGQLSLWLRFGYLTAARASEVCRIAHGQGKLKSLPPEGDQPAVADAYLALRDHKTSESTQSDRLIVLSPQALTVLRQLAPLPRVRHAVPRLAARLASDEVDPVVGWMNELSKHCRAAGVPGWPHRMRDSAATHLLAAGVDPATVDLILGHVPKGELARYGRPSLRVLRAAVARIQL